MFFTNKVTDKMISEVATGIQQSTGYDVTNTRTILLYFTL